MEAGGWVIDVSHVGGAPGTEQYVGACEGSPFWGYSHDSAVGKVSTVFQGHGEGKIDFGNCYYKGVTNVHLNSVLIGKANPNQKSVVKTFHYKPGDVLRLEEVNAGIIAINSLQIMCGDIGKRYKFISGVEYIQFFDLFFNEFENII